jgi:asparagine synthase (glutamine-hydrolysing)
MCGIAGQIRLFNNKKVRKEEIVKMLDIISHRGPDGMGIHESTEAIFGMRRLSIIDLESGWQPLYNEDRSISCCANAEIYNYKELRIEMELLGHKFYTHSDIEVILHLYEEYGVDFISKINGMYAIVLWDENKKRFLLYRDRVGKKPLYYTINNGILAFSSEIKSLLVCEGVKRECDKEALNSLLSYNYIPDKLTIFKGIFKLLPASYILVQDGNIKIDSYWELPLSQNEGHYNENDIIDELAQLLDDSVQLRLRSDVPLGAFLSGGVDSSVVVGTASKYVDRLQTFSIGFNEESFNELPYANKVAAIFNTNHITETVTPSFFDLLPKTIWHNDNPHGDVSFLPTYVLSELSSRHVRVVLTGDGGDELFGGYDKYLKFAAMNNTEEDLYRAYYEDTSVFSMNEKQLLFSEKFKNDVCNIDSFYIVNDLFKQANAKTNGADPMNAILYSEIKMLLDGNNLVKPDRMGMANSIEARMPLLDYRIVEFVSKLPSEYKVRDNVTKYIFKKLAERILPRDIVYRKKQMFTVPIGEWLKNDLKDFAFKILLDKKTLDRGYFNEQYVRNMLEEHVGNKSNYTRQLRLLLIIELWHRIYIDNFFVVPPSIEQLV